MSTETNGSSGALVPIAPSAVCLDGWVIPPDTATRRKRGRGSGRRTESMAQPLTDLVEQFCNFQRKQRGKTEGGVKTSDGTWSSC